ncbi:MAG: methyltransferase domain-containing protein [Pseudodesulfovibrio sp.]
MKRNEAVSYVCPASKEPLDLEIVSLDGEEVLEGRFVAPNGNAYPVRRGIPDFRYPFELAPSDETAKAWYDNNAREYESYLHLTFDSFGVDEADVRRRMIDKMAIGPGSVALEVGAGTGRDSVVIAERLQGRGKLFLQDISLPVLEMNVAKAASGGLCAEFHVGNGCHLPFPDDFFDAAYHFGGVNTFSDIAGFFVEMNRVVRPGGKVVVGDEGVPVWLRNTEYAKILMNSNPSYEYDVPLDQLPVSCRNVTVEWLLGDVFYVIDYVVGEGEPVADFDFEIPGARGGTHRTRYEGQLEGVTPEAKALAHKARARKGMSMHKWLDEVVRAAARRDLEEE